MPSGQVPRNLASTTLHYNIFSTIRWTPLYDILNLPDDSALDHAGEPLADVGGELVPVADVLAPHHELLLGVPEDEVGVEAPLDAALPVVEAGQPRRVARHQPVEVGQPEAPAAPLRPEEGKTQLGSSLQMTSANLFF